MEGQEQQQVDIYALVDAYKDLLDTKEELKELTTGFVYSLGEKTEYSKRGCNEEEFFDFLRSIGLGDIIKPTVNARTLNSSMKETIGMLREEAEAERGEMGEDEPDLPSNWVPEEFTQFISAYSFYDVTKRKETNTTAKKARNKA